MYSLWRRCFVVVILASVSFLIACGGGGAAIAGNGTSGGSPTPTPTPNGGPPPVPLTSHTDWAFLGAKVDAGDDNFSPIRFIVLDQSRSQVFISIPNSNEVRVYDTGTHALKATIPISAPLALGLTVDGSQLYVGSGTNFLYVVDPAALQVTEIVNTTTILAGGFSVETPISLSNGQVLLMPPEGVDGATAFVLWTPASGSATVVPVPPSLFGFGAIVPSGDHSKVLIAGTLTNSSICIFDSATDQFIFAPGPSDIAERVAANPVKDQFAVSDLDGNISLYDSKFNILGSIRIEPPNQVGGQRLNGMLFSGDGNRLYLFVDATIQGYDTIAFQQFGVMAQPFSLGIFSDPLPFEEMGGTVLAVNEDGLDFIDVSSLGNNGMKSAPFGFGFGLSYLSPNTGPLQGGTPATISIGTGAQFSPPTTVGAYLGRQPVSNQVYNAGKLTFNTPAGAAPGTADLIIQSSDGTALFAPAAFSYSPSVLHLTTTRASSAGGGHGFLAGYGLGSDPSALQITIGGTSATVTQIQNSLSGLDSPFPTPIQAAIFNIPPAAAGFANLNVSNANGSTSLPSAFLYSQPMLMHAASGQIEAGVFDPNRHQIYFTATNQILVFSTASGQFLTPFSIPQPGTAQLLGIALSPDGNTLAIGDQGNHSIITLNPDTPATTHVFSAPDGGIGLVPAGLAVDNSGIVYFDIAFAFSGFGDRCQTGLFWKLDTTAGQFTNLTSTTTLCVDPQNRVLITPDGSTVFFDADGQLVVFTAGTANLVTVPEPNNAQSDMALSEDGSRLIQQFVVFASTGDVLGSPVWTDIDLSDSQTLEFGQKLDKTGSLLLQPWSAALDLVDLGHFHLRQRLALPQTVANVFDALVIDNLDDRAFLIVSGGILEIPLSPVPPVLTSVTPATGAAGGGTLVTLSGSGFTTGMTATVAGIAVTPTFIDEHTLSLQTPAHAAGGVRITVTSPDSESSFLDAAFTYTGGSVPAQKVSGRWVSWPQRVRPTSTLLRQLEKQQNSVPKPNGLQP